MEKSLGPRCVKSFYAQYHTQHTPVKRLDVNWDERMHSSVNAKRDSNLIRQLKPWRIGSMIRAVWCSCSGKGRTANSQHLAIEWKRTANTSTTKKHLAGKICIVSSNCKPQRRERLDHGCNCSHECYIYISINLLLYISIKQKVEYRNITHGD